MSSRVGFGIIGGGVAGLSLAHFLHRSDVVVIEKEAVFGGLARSYEKNGLFYDVGPHIMFSKNKAVLDFMKELTTVDNHRRSNMVLHRGRHVLYPFENHLGQLESPEEIDYCLSSFLDNPYESLRAENMLAFFLKNFGEGITRLYLQPYNEKIWKFDPSMLNTKMVERIPRPPAEDIIKSARGQYSDGYLHQLFFSYPRRGGIQSLVDGLIARVSGQGARLSPQSPVQSIVPSGKGWAVRTEKETFECERIVNCMPLTDFIRLLPDVPESVEAQARALKFNSLCTVIVNTRRDRAGDHFTFTVAQKDVIFHRINKLDFMGEAYHLADSASFLLEITYRAGDLFSRWDDSTVIQRCVEDMVKIGFIEKADDVNWTELRREKMAYVLYDLDHAQNSSCVLKYLQSRGIESVGRFAEFEYLNMDAVIERAQALAGRLSSDSLSIVNGR